MRFFKIFFLHFQDVFEQRARSFVFFLISLVNPLILILFWKGATRSSSFHPTDWTFSTILSYYLFLTIASALLVSRIEDDVATQDIKQGQLAGYLLRPFPYIWKKFFEEIPQRLLQGMYAFVTFGIFFFFLSGKITA